MIEVSLRVSDDVAIPEVLQHLEESGVASDRIDVLTREPLPHSVTRVRPSRMSKIGLAGAVFGFTAAVAGLVTVTLSVGLRTGGMPMIAPLPIGVITYEMTLLASILAIVATLFVGARLGPGRRAPQHPELAYGEAIVSVTCTDVQEAERVHGTLAALPAARILLSLLLLLALSGLRAAPAAAQSFDRDCAPCHGRQGEGRIGPQLAARAWTAEAFTARVRNGGHIMPPFAQSALSDTQVKGLLAYVNGLPAPAAGARLPAPDPRAPGSALFTTYCIGCHGLEGRGSIGPGILNTALTPAQLAHQVRTGGGLMPRFAPAQVSDAQIRQVYAYLHPPLPRPDPGRVEPLPSVPNYLSDALFALGALALLGQVVSERRRRLGLRLRVEERAVRERFPEFQQARLRVSVF